MNLPNKLTTLRILMVIPFLIFSFLFLANEGKYSFTDLNNKTIYFLIALIIFILAMITDWLDGYIARKRNIVTTYGKLFDPLADKIMTSSAFIILSMANLVPIWITIPMIMRDIIVDGCRNLLAKNDAKVAASFVGKAKTMLQSIGIILIFIIVPALEVVPRGIGDISCTIALINLPLYFGLILSIYSGINYAKRTLPYIKIR